MNYKKEIIEFVKKYAYNTKLTWDYKKRQLKLIIVGKDGQKIILRAKTYAELSISKNFKVYWDNSTVLNFCGV